jgi:hypothetical protein
VIGAAPLKWKPALPLLSSGHCKQLSIRRYIHARRSSRAVWIFTGGKLWTWEAKTQPSQRRKSQPSLAPKLNPDGNVRTSSKPRRADSPSVSDEHSVVVPPGRETVGLPWSRSHNGNLPVPGAIFLPDCPLQFATLDIGASYRSLSSEQGATPLPSPTGPPKPNDWKTLAISPLSGRL